MCNHQGRPCPGKRCRCECMNCNEFTFPAPPVDEDNEKPTCEGFVAPPTWAWMHCDGCGLRCYDCLAVGEGEQERLLCERCRSSDRFVWEPGDVVVTPPPSESPSSEG